jgi:hypothetical protein
MRPDGANITRISAITMASNATADVTIQASEQKSMGRARQEAFKRSRVTTASPNPVPTEAAAARRRYVGDARDGRPRPNETTPSTTRPTLNPRAAAGRPSATRRRARRRLGDSRARIPNRRTRRSRRRYRLLARGRLREPASRSRSPVRCSRRDRRRRRRGGSLPSGQRGISSGQSVSTWCEDRRTSTTPRHTSR